MTVRTFGPIRGAGTRIEEQQGDQSITPGALGWAAMAGITQKGAVGKLIVCQSKTEFTKRCGGVISDSLLPDCASDYYDLANGAGGLVILRVTDGNEVAASHTLYARRITGGFVAMGTLSAQNGGRWGGPEKRFVKQLDSIAGLTNTTLQIGAANANDFKQDEWKGGYIELTAVASKRYPITGNTAAGLITVSSDQTMRTDWNTGPSLQYYLTIENTGTGVQFIISDGEENPDTEFAIEVLLDGASVKKYGNLSTDPASARYWVNVINNDDDNAWITATDLWTGAQAADVRPANFYGSTASCTSTVLTATVHTFKINSPTGGNPTFSLGATDDNMLAQTITITMSSPTAGTAVSDRFGSLGSVTLGSLFTSPNKWTPPFTVTAGGTPLAATDTLVIVYRPFRANQLIGGFLYPDKVGHKRDKFRITANTNSTITVSAGDMTASGGAPSSQYNVVAPQFLRGGRDGNSTVGDTQYTQQAWDVTTSPFNNLEGKNLGLVKFATPGINSTAVQKAGGAYAQAKNHQYRNEIPANVTTDTGALAYINDTIGRNDYAVHHFPSYGDVPDPDPASSREGKRKTIPLTGMILGREARIAVDFQGYHKAAAGIDATLPRLMAIPTGDRHLDEESLNPAGINVIKKKNGNFVIWGDRVSALDSNWKFKHQREQMSYYEHVLSENFDFIIFTINDTDSDAQAITSLIQFFQPEFVKRALRGKTFQDACSIKVDAELNTDASRANGDKIAAVTLRLADTTERFIIRIGKAGIFEAVA